MFSHKTIIALIIVIAALAVSLQAQTLIYVDQNAPGANNGTSWTDAYLDLQSALALSGTDAIIRVADGTYNPGPAREDTYSLKNGVALEGGYAGSGAPDQDARNFLLYETILHGNDHNYHVVTAIETDATAIIDGFTITGGNADDEVPISFPDGYGGGLFAESGTVTAIHCIFSANQAFVRGGGMYTRDCTVLLTGCTFINNAVTDPGPASQGRGGGLSTIYCHMDLTDCLLTQNTATKSGGGIYNEYFRSLAAQDCVLSDNQAPAGGGMYNSHCDGIEISNWTITGNSAQSGGGIYNYNCNSLTVHDCNLSNNSAESAGGPAYGGGIYNYYSYPITVFDCLFSANSADGWNEGGKGGGFCCREVGEEVVSISDCTFIDNVSNGAGGGISNHLCDDHIVENCLFLRNTTIRGGGIYSLASRTPRITGCIFKENAAQSGGGIYNNVSNPELVNCLFVKNSAEWGAGVGNWQASDHPIRHCTFFANTALSEGGGIHNYNSDPLITSCISWGNLPDDLFNIESSDPVVTFSCLEGGYTGRGNIAEDPRFVDEVNDDFHLSQDSPCINRGTNDGAPLQDLEGDTRLIMGTVDMGVDEYTGTHSLGADSFALSQSIGGSVALTLQAGSQQAGKWYVLLGTLSETAPGFALPGGQATLPINFDGFTNQVLARLNTPIFTDFLAILDGVGSSVASVTFQANMLPVGWIGKTMYFAYTVETYDMVSNPVQVDLLP